MKKATSLAHTTRLLMLFAPCVPFVLSAPAASAATLVNFENPPYIVDSIVGQDDWTSNSYGDNGNTLANANIVTTGALSGSHSVSILGGVGADTFVTAHDISKGLTDMFVDQGPGDDLELSLLFRKGATGTGVFGLSEDGFNGGTPDFVFVSDTTIKAFGAGATTTVIGTYVPDHVFQFILGFDLLGNTYDVRWRDVTANGNFTAPFLINQYLEGGGGYLGDGADPSTLTDPDLLLGARNSGTNSFFDNVQLYAVPVPEPAGLFATFVGAAMLISGRRRQTSLRTHSTVS
jgi:hypothetical protein